MRLIGWSMGMGNLRQKQSGPVLPGLVWVAPGLAISGVSEAGSPN
jgi:hypothetical protein